MKLIIAIIQGDSEFELIQALNKSAFMITKLASTGGFLKRGNTTLIIGVEKDRLEEALNIIREICKMKTNTEYAYLQRDPALSLVSPYPYMEIHGGATVFVVDVDRFEKI